MFDKAVALGRKSDRWYSERHYPFIGYKRMFLLALYMRVISEMQLDSLLSDDLLERYKYFRKYGSYALLLTVLAYNVGH